MDVEAFPIQLVPLSLSVHSLERWEVKATPVSILDNLQFVGIKHEIAVWGIEWPSKMAS